MSQHISDSKHAETILSGQFTGIVKVIVQHNWRFSKHATFKLHEHISTLFFQISLHSFLAPVFCSSCFDRDLLPHNSCGVQVSELGLEHLHNLCMSSACALPPINDSKSYFLDETFVWHLLSAMYQPLSMELKRCSLIRAGHSQRQALVFSTNAFPWCPFVHNEK